MTGLAAEEAGGRDGAALDERIAPAALGPVPRVSIQVFCESEAFAATVETAFADRRLSRAHGRVQAGGLAAAAMFYRKAPTPNLIIVETQLGGEPLLAEIDRLKQVCDSGTRLVVVGRTNDVGLYRLLMRHGVDDYLVAPVDEAALIRSIAELYSEAGKAPVGRMVAFIGAKGGAGSSTIAHNVAWQIANGFASDVVLADLDIAFGTAGLDFNQDPQRGVVDAIQAPQRLDDALLDQLLARCSDHLSLLAAPATLERPCDYPASTFETVIDVARGGVPTLVLDLPHVWTGWMRRVLLAADEIVLTAEPDLANLRNAKNILDLLRAARPAAEPPRLVVNKQGMAKRPEIRVADFAAALSLEPSAVIGFDPQLFGTASNNGRMIGETDARSAAAAGIDRIAQIVTAGSAAEPKTRSARRPLLSRLRKRGRGKV